MNYEELRTYPPVPEQHDVDVVLPWLNPTDKWFAEYKKYCKDEDPCRIRDLNTIQPTLAGILKNLTWVRYIWLIVYDEEQISNVKFPELSNSKVKIVYHKDFIPSEFLPNFNSLICAMFMNRIDGLADNILFFNDDMLVTKPLSKDNYFIDGMSVHHKSKQIRKSQTAQQQQIMWGKIIENTHTLLKLITHGTDYSINNFHMPMPLTKTMLDFLWYKYNKELYESCVNARSRQPHSISLPELAYWIEEIYDKCKYKNIYNTIKHSFLVLDDSTTKQHIAAALKNSDIVCLNDSENLQKKHEEIGSYIKELTMNT